MSRVSEVIGSIQREDYQFECNPAVHNVQRELNRAAGRQVVAESGVFDVKTEEALRAFQRDQGLPVTGTIDSDTVERLSQEAEERESLPTNSNAERTLARRMLPYADAGITSSGDSAYAGVAMMKGTEKLGSNATVSADLMYASVQVGAQTEFSAGMARLGSSIGVGQRAHLDISGEVFTVRANRGIHNDDGSTGYNLGVGGTIAGVEATLDSGEGNSVTLGVSYGSYMGGSVGVRDSDNDGKGEGCVRLATPVATVGACVESPW